MSTCTGNFSIPNSYLEKGIEATGRNAFNENFKIFPAELHGNTHPPFLRFVII
jgi:hypothetical protein